MLGAAGGDALSATNAGVAGRWRIRWMRMDEDRLVGDTLEVSGSFAENLVGNPL